MSDALAIFWDRLDRREAAFTADEVGVWPEALRNLLAAAGILRRGANARCVPCDSCDTGHIEAVSEVPNPDGSLRFHIPCPENGRVRVSPERLLRWVADLGALADAAAQGLGCGDKATAIVPGRVWELGRIARGGSARNVVLARGLTWPDARKVVLDSRKIAIAAPPLVLAVGRLPSDDLWGNRIPPVLSLNRVLCLDGAITARWDLLDAVLAAKPAQPDPAQRHRLRASRANAVDALTRAMADHLRAARDHSFSLKQRGVPPSLLPRPTQEQLAKMAGVSVSTTNRCLRSDPNAKQLRIYWEAAEELRQVLAFKG